MLAGVSSYLAKEKNLFLYHCGASASLVLSSMVAGLSLITDISLAHEPDMYLQMHVRMHTHTYEDAKKAS